VKAALYDGVKSVSIVDRPTTTADPGEAVVKMLAVRFDTGGTLSDVIPVANTIERGFEGAHPDTLKTFLAFNKVVNSFERLMIKDLSEGGAQLSQVTCLRLLVGRDGLCQRDIADAMRISRARVTAIVQALEKAGAIRRERDNVDARLIRVYVTDVGREIDRQKGHVREARMNEIFADMDDEYRVDLCRRLDDLTERIQSVLHANGPTPASDSTPACAAS
jgi:MarR family transcriptional regulator, organic hydroperoxide resistance regulator